MEKYNLGQSLNNLEKTLFKEICNSNKVIIVSHNHMDFDALASSTALAEIVKSYGQEAYIVTNDDENTMKDNFRSMFYEVKNKYNVINSEQLIEIQDSNDLVILTDVNSIRRTPLKNINNFNRIIVIDHHELDDEVVNTDNLFVNQDISSASEILFTVLKKLDIYIEQDLAQRLLAGIYQDTTALFLLKNSSTLLTLTKLFDYGANFQEIQELFTLDFNEDRIINDLIDCTRFYKYYNEVYSYNVAITMNTDEPEKIYTSEQLANAVDYLLKYSVNAAFVIGFTDRACLGEGHKDRISIKARSKFGEKEFVDVGSIMRLINGGGGKNRAAATIKTSNIDEVADSLIELIRQNQDMEYIEEKEKTFSLKNRTL